MKKIPVSLCFLFLSLLGVSACRKTAAFNFGPYSEAEHYYQKGDYQKAITKYGEYLRENRGGNLAAISYYYMAKSYENLGEREEARRIYRKIDKEYPHLIWADFARARLRELRLESRQAGLQSRWTG